jgi:prepilin-type N-terminal cleavage/methylation domain-containing protein
MVNKRAFSLVELLIVISIIGVLVTLVAVTVRPIQTKSRDAKRKSDLNLYLSGLDLFKTDFKLYPNHTFYVGKNEADTGALTSNFDLANDIASCEGLQGSGHPDNFAAATDFQLVTGPHAYDEEILAPGFSAVNHFMICLKYIDRLVADPTLGSGVAGGYHYLVSYDYVDALVSAVLENTNDLDARTLFNAAVPKRYYLGSGLTVRHLDDDSDSDADEEGPNEFFYQAFGSPRQIVNGRYLYQCNGKVADQDIKRDDRSLSANAPLVYQTNAWRANPNCRDADSSLDDATGY